MAATVDSLAGYAPLNAATGKVPELAMQRLWLRGHLLPAGGRLLVHHVFRCAETKPVEVVYAFVLPRDAALRRFSLRGEGFTAHSELQTTGKAIEIYERGLAQGSLSTLARQHGDGIVNLTVGNIRPEEKVTVTLEILAGIEARDGGFRFRFPFTLAPSYHRKAKALEVEPGAAEIELPEEEFGDVMLPRFVRDASNLHAVGFDLRILGDLSEVASPSHAIRVRTEGNGARAVLAVGREVPDRDLVLDVVRKNEAPQVLAGRASDGKKHFVAMIPSTCFGASKAEARRVVFVVDRSGSMQGLPMAQARKAVEACLGALAAEDEFGVVAFDDRPEILAQTMLPATRQNRDRARAFLDTIEARGGTRLAEAVEAAAQVLGSGGDVLLMTDGQVFGTEEILARARATGLRLHCLGIGSASQDRFLALLGRETGGVSRFVTPRERVDLSAIQLFASVGRPVASDLRVTGGLAQPDPAPHVFAGSPLFIYGEVEKDEIEITWAEGSLRVPIPNGNPRTAETVRLLRGARLITDFERRYPVQQAGKTGERIANQLRQLSEAYGLASREMTLVAVVKRESDRPHEVPKTIVVPVGMPQDTQFDAVFGLRPAPNARFAAASMLPMGAPSAAGAAPPAPAMEERLRLASHKPKERPQRLADRLRDLVARKAPEPEVPDPADTLVELAAQIESDGGMPGTDPEDRLRRSVLALMAFVEEGHTVTAGAFRLHVARLAGFLEAADAGSHRPAVDAALRAARGGAGVPGAWIEMARADGGASWREIEASLIHRA